MFTLDYLSPNLEVIPSKNYSKSISLPSAYKSEIMLKMVGFFDSKPKDCMADLSSRGSILPVASVSKRLKASLSYSISSSVRPGLSIFFLAPVFASGFPLIVKQILINFYINKSYPISAFNSSKISFIKALF